MRLGWIDWVSLTQRVCNADTGGFGLGFYQDQLYLAMPRSRARKSNYHH
jgi:hypothetical protein